MLEGQIRKTALAYMFLTVFVGTVGMAAWMPYRLAAEDVAMIVTAGACSLLALAPPQHWFCRLLALGGMGIAVWSQFKG